MEEPAHQEALVLSPSPTHEKTSENHISQTSSAEQQDETSQHTAIDSEQPQCAVESIVKNNDLPSQHPLSLGNAHDSVEQSAILNQQSLSEVQQQNQRPQTEATTNQLDEAAKPTNEEPDSSTQMKQGAEEDEFNEEDLEDDDRMLNDKNCVMEISPKGRFKRFGEELGRGAYKIVYKGVDNETGREIAWNVISLNRLPKQDRVRIKSEIDLIKKLQHKNIIHFISAWYNKDKEQVIFITEMITGGSLRKYVKRIKTPRLKVIKGWCKEILQGLVYLHDQKPHPIIHRDLKCDNIFINSNSGDIRIGDLGLSTPMHKSFTTSVLGTPEFMAPELYQECYGTGVDIYAFGMCVLEMLTLERPYKECQNPAQIYFKVVNGIHPKALDRIQDEEIKDFILLCLGRADRRPSAKELLESQFLNETESEKNNQEVLITRSQSMERKKGAGSAAISTKTLDTVIAQAAKEQMLLKQTTTIQEEDEEQSGDSKTFRKKGGETQNGGTQSTLSPSKTQNIEEEHKIANSDSHLIEPVSSQETETHTGIKVQENITVLAQQTPNEPNVSQSIVQPVLESKNIQNELQVPEMIKNDHLRQTELHYPVEKHEVEYQHPSSHQDLEQNKVEINKKKQKQDAKTQLLDQSVSFLQKIDEDKQKRLQELSVIPPMQDDDDDGGQDGCCNIAGNILDELKRQDMLEEKQRHLAEQLLEHAHVPGQSMSGVTKEKAQKQANTDSSETQLMHQGKKEIPNSFGKEDASGARKFGLEKKFKEDQLQHQSNIMKSGVSSQSVKQNPNAQKVATKQKNGSNADLIKSATAANEEAKKHQQVTGGQVSSDYQQTKTSQSNPSQFAKKQVQETQKSQIPPSPNPTPAPTTQATNPKGQELVFDVQNSSSSESSSENQDQDSEVEKIQIPRTQVNDLGKAQNQGGKVEAEKAFQAQQMKSGSQVMQGGIFNQSKHLQPQSQQMSHKTTSSPAPKPLTTPQTQRPSEQSSGNLSQSITSQSKSQQKKEEQKPTQMQKINSTTSASKQNPVISSSVEVASCKDTQYQLVYKKDGKDIYFSFDTRTDTPEVVAREMVREFKYNESQFEVISKQIQSAIMKKETSAKGNATESNPKPSPGTQSKSNPVQLQSSSNTSAPAQVITAPAQQTTTPTTPLVNATTTQQQPQQKSPSKLQKDFTINMFNRLLQDVEFFYTQMQIFGINDTEEIVEAMDCSNDEKIIKMNFINKVLMSKREYKQQLENYKLKQQKKSVAQQAPKQGAGASITDKQQPKSTTQPPASTSQPQQSDSSEFLNMTFSVPSIKGTSSNLPIVQTQPALPLGQSKQQKLQQSPPTLAQMTSDKTSQDAPPSSNQQNYANKKQSSFDNNQIQGQIPSQSLPTDKKLPKEIQKLTFVIPQSIRDYFKASPQQFSCPSRLSKDLKKIPYEDMLEQPDDEVIQLQHLLNLMWHDSILVYSQKASTQQEAIEIIKSHVPLKIDGIFGSKTEKCVFKFQQFKGIPQSGIVSDHVWQQMLTHADQIVGEQKQHQFSLDSQIPSNPFAKQPTQPQSNSHHKSQHFKAPKEGGFSFDQQKSLPTQSMPIQLISSSSHQPSGVISPNKAKQSQVHQPSQDPTVDYNMLMEKYYLPQMQQQQESQQKSGFNKSLNAKGNTYPQYFTSAAHEGEYTHEEEAYEDKDMEAEQNRGDEDPEGGSDCESNGE